MNKKEALKSALEGKKITSPNWGNEYITWCDIKNNFIKENGLLYHIETMREEDFQIYIETFTKEEAIKKMLDGLMVKNEICSNTTSFYFDRHYKTFKQCTDGLVTCFNINNIPDEYWYLEDDK
jgi:hypothetical protein